jgi:hypothetical protein
MPIVTDQAVPSDVQSIVGSPCRASPVNPGRLGGGADDLLKVVVIHPNVGFFARVSFGAGETNVSCHACLQISAQALAEREDPGY